MRLYFFLMLFLLGFCTIYLDRSDVGFLMLLLFVVVIYVGYAYYECHVCVYFFLMLFLLGFCTIYLDRSDVGFLMLLLFVVVIYVGYAYYECHVCVYCRWM